jgi:hypothetical protein
MSRPSLTRAWLKNGSPPLEDLAGVLDIYFVDLMRIMKGHKEPSDDLKTQFAEIFNEPVEKLFPDYVGGKQ